MLKKFSVLLPANSYVYLSHWDFSTSYKEITSNLSQSLQGIFLNRPQQVLQAHILICLLEL